MLTSGNFVRGIQIVLLAAAALAVYELRWTALFVALCTWALTLSPKPFARWLGIDLPPSFLVAIVFFIFATLFLGEVGDFYERFWWWDVVLHGGSALALGLFAFLFIFMLFEGDHYAAPPWAVGYLSFTVAMAIGACWEIFEFGMDQAFGLNMQKSGLVDTMWDLIVDFIGASIAGVTGFLYLKRVELGSLRFVLDDFVIRNRKLYRKLRRRPEAD